MYIYTQFYNIFPLPQSQLFVFCGVAGTCCSDLGCCVCAKVITSYEECCLNMGGVAFGSYYGPIKLCIPWSVYKLCLHAHVMYMYIYIII